jgi:hypothetical protein
VDAVSVRWRGGGFLPESARLIDARAFAAYLAPPWNTKWVVYCKRPFGGPKQVLRYLARYTHRIAISNRRLIACDQKGVTFKWKDYRLEGSERYKVMTLATHEFIRRFLMHVLPAGFHRIRYYGLLASGKRAENAIWSMQRLQQAGLRRRREGDPSRSSRSQLHTFPLLHATLKRVEIPIPAKAITTQKV